MIFNEHEERRDENNPKLLHIITNARNHKEKWLEDRINMYKSRGFQVKVKYITGKKKGKNR